MVGIDAMVIQVHEFLASFVSSTCQEVPVLNATIKCNLDFAIILQVEALAHTHTHKRQDGEERCCFYSSHGRDGNFMYRSGVKT
mmetsp:Transcript_50097/g.89944  ORF Transcript_50097/g.89944 Transcript_50097/m.89944 type:complete len:84 (-) Transcript_50097:37-288(-)